VVAGVANWESRVKKWTWFGEPVALQPFVMLVWMLAVFDLLGMFWGIWCAGEYSHNAV